MALMHHARNILVHFTLHFTEYILSLLHTSEQYQVRLADTKSRADIAYINNHDYRKPLFQKHLPF